VYVFHTEVVFGLFFFRVFFRFWGWGIVGHVKTSVRGHVRRDTYDCGWLICLGPAARAAGSSKGRRRRRGRRNKKSRVVMKATGLGLLLPPWGAGG
jgi:hypothetical protein